jgi:hypothetical protein
MHQQDLVVMYSKAVEHPDNEVHMQDVFISLNIRFEVLADKSVKVRPYDMWFTGLVKRVSSEQELISIRNVSQRNIVTSN